jgi:hypothetical protein
MILSTISENSTLLNNGSNGDSVPATVPGTAVIRLTRQRLSAIYTNFTWSRV